MLPRLGQPKGEISFFVSHGYIEEFIQSLRKISFSRKVRKIMPPWVRSIRYRGSKPALPMEGLKPWSELVVLNGRRGDAAASGEQASASRECHSPP
jgi:hypothetical protein